MTESDESEKAFTVSDRRHFTPEGRPRDADEAGVSGAAGDEPGGEAPAGAPDETPGAGPLSEGARQPAAAGPAEFSGFVMGLAAQAGALLSGQGLPEPVEAGEALEGARSLIAILEMLKEKTAGNLREPEANLLDEILFQLRMAYVNKTRTGGA